MYNFIKTYSQFVLNETLKTHDINLTVSDIESELSSLRYNFNIEKKNNNTIKLILHNFCYVFNPSTTLNHLDSLFINRHGWFPSSMNILYLSGMNKTFIYNEKFLIDNISYINVVDIIYESKFNIELDNIPNTLYHLSIQEYEKKTMSLGLIPKSKSKLSKHLDRIYLCVEIDDCYKLIDRMKIYYDMTKPYKSKINDKWVIYKIKTNNLNIKLYNDPNYLNLGYYCIDNVPKSNIEIIDKEK